MRLSLIVSSFLGSAIYIVFGMYWFIEKGGEGGYFLTLPLVMVISSTINIYYLCRKKLIGVYSFMYSSISIAIVLLFIEIDSGQKVTLPHVILALFYLVVGFIFTFKCRKLGLEDEKNWPY